MGATFPNGIASFKQHKDLLDDVEAADINKIQDELVAVQEALGDAINTIATVEEEVDVLEFDEQLQFRIDTWIFSAYTNTKQLLNALWDGQNIYAASTSVANKKLVLSSKNRSGPPDLVRLAKPDAADDPMKMWNGTGFTLKKSGFWIAQGRVDVNIGNPGDSGNFGTYEASVTIDGNNWRRGVDRQYAQSDLVWHDVSLNPLLMGWFPKGTHLTLRAAQSSNHDQNIATGSLAVYRVRGR